MNPTRGRRNGGSSVLLVIMLVAARADMAAAQQTGQGPSYFNPSMAVIIVVLVTAFFFLGFFSIYIRRCAGGPLGGPGEDLGARPDVGGLAFLTSGAARSRRMRGLDPAALEALPTMAYADVKAHKVGKGELECAVCLSEFDDDDTLRLLPKCSHAFHVDCIDAWLASHVTCPVCRANLVPGADAPAPSGAAAAASATPERDVVAATSAPQPEQETPTAPPEQVTVVITDAAEETEEERVRREEAAELVRIGSVKRALRSKSGRSPAAQFPRSHTTGHSLAAAPAESAERYTLRLPEHVLREVVAAGKLRRTKSLQAFREGRAGGSTRRGSRSVRLGQSGRWPAITMSSFLGLSFSAWGSSWRGEADAAGKGGAKVAGDGTAAAEQQCDGGACPLPLGGRRV
ncbi:hypothetical protein CFC21_091854 [Triticum aestivum]|uniref:RING-type E3 ubiquitin transferase n=4 Tax=Triticinae TaxID=1648030 RepID=A0A3B6QBW0_WHEAT|nr:E3 ubiquitin-protein ligase ATL6-like [Aegilops tauschii subsp. strangulata]XP_044416355.1 E3 ubiquitin-protein ligase ATL6-like [Triticum aestivum]KAF7088785.1 hypothetical protein CFC21_091854 [Triticum aestivum]